MINVYVYYIQHFLIYIPRYNKKYAKNFKMACIIYFKDGQIFRNRFTQKILKQYKPINVREVKL